jgi:hypothetical protein
MKRRHASPSPSFFFFYGRLSVQENPNIICAQSRITLRARQHACFSPSKAIREASCAGSYAGFAV